MTVPTPNCIPLYGVVCVGGGIKQLQAQVRAEYSWVPAPLFCSKRRAVLAEFLARQPIYNTPRLREALEHQARENLAWSLEQLDG